MVRIRKTDGTTVEIPQGAFVELVNDQDGTLNLVCYQQDANTVIQVPPNTPDADRYAGLFRRQGVRFNAAMILREVR